MSLLRSYISLIVEAVYWGSKASGIMYVCKETNEVLLLKRSQEVMQPGTWGIAGGATDEEGMKNNNVASQDPSNERWLKSAKRETIEEMGSLPATTQLITITTFRDKNFAYRTYVYNVAKETRHSFVPQLNWENDDHEWFSLDKYLTTFILALDSRLTSYEHMKTKEELIKSIMENERFLKSIDDITDPEERKKSKLSPCPSLRRFQNHFNL